MTLYSSCRSPFLVDIALNEMNWIGGRRVIVAGVLKDSGPSELSLLQYALVVIE